MKISAYQKLLGRLIGSQYLVVIRKNRIFRFTVTPVDNSIFDRKISLEARDPHRKLSIPISEGEYSDVRLPTPQTTQRSRSNLLNTLHSFHKSAKDLSSELISGQFQ